MRPGPKQEQGFTLLEVLASIVILSIVSLVLTSFFTQAMTYSKSNQNKTIMVNLARNALFYMEKQDFAAMQKFFEEEKDGALAERCTVTNCTVKTYIDAFDEASLATVLNTQINNIDYRINIIYQPSLLDNNPPEGGQALIDKTAIKEYLVPVKAVVKRVESSGQPDYTVEVEGYITDERIR